MYFKQAAYGVPVRMALIASLLELQPALAAQQTTRSGRYRVYSRAGGLECSNERCVSRAATEQRYLTPRFWILQDQPPTLRCVYCDVEQQPRAFGTASTHKFATDIAAWQQVSANDLVFFADPQQAAAAGFEERKTKPRKKGARNQLVAK